MRNVYFLFFIVLFGCGKKFDTVDDVEPLYGATQNKNTFIEETKEFFILEQRAIPTPKKSIVYWGDTIMDKIPINLHDVQTLYKKQGFVAVCRKSSKSGRKEILVDRKFWQDNITNKNLLKALIIHELGHCHLGKNHNDPSGGCRSIMETKLIMVYDPSKNQDYFAKELFTPPKTCIPLP